MELDLYSTPLHFDPEKAATPTLQMELIELQQFQDLEVKFLENDLPVFYRKYFLKEKFPELWMFAVRQNGIIQVNIHSWAFLPDEYNEYNQV